ncbi:hypothetical protein TIFTF001_009381 [Ficus carica]|uniref:Uncharacterized protein n=1 Tax=Ficus carica TaxID=3494 RepID=A0AA88CYX7_FICCA|nr:hypothetical protein TIFTF001_009381 [Ficus carica]
MMAAGKRHCCFDKDGGGCAGLGRPAKVRSITTLSLFMSPISARSSVAVAVDCCDLR